MVSFGYLFTSRGYKKSPCFKGFEFLSRFPILVFDDRLGSIGKRKVLFEIIFYPLPPIFGKEEVRKILFLPTSQKTLRQDLSGMGTFPSIS